MAREGLIKNCVIFDLDGTIANVDHRVHLIRSERPDWRRFFKACVYDAPNLWCLELMAAMYHYGYDIHIVSARSREVYNETLHWLRQHVPAGVNYRFHMIRDEGNSVPDQVLKKKWLDSFDSRRILFVVDDRQRVVDMWRSNGLTALQCAQWEEYRKEQKENTGILKRVYRYLVG